MKEYIKLAWRNIWRNKRRTLITAASILFAVFFAIVMRSFQLGTYSHMINQTIESYLGYLQVQNPKYFDEPTIDYALDFDPELIKEINTADGIKITVPRITNFSFASYGEKSKGILVLGIDPLTEKDVSNPEHHLVKYRLTEDVITMIKSSVTLPEKQEMLLEEYRNSSFKSIEGLKLALKLKDKQFNEIVSKIAGLAAYKGNYLSQEDDGVLVSDRLSKYLKINVGDTLVLLGQGYHGVSAAGLFPVRGIVRIPAPDLDNKLVYMTLKQAQIYMGMDGLITSLAINLDNPDEMMDVQQKLITKVDNQKYVVKNWQELNPTLKQQIDGDDKSGQMFVAILYLIVFFGIFGTVLMMIAERRREFGVMVAIGMRKVKLTIIVVIEMIFIGLIGTIAGMIASSPLIILGYYRPLRYTGKIAKMVEEMGFDPVMPMEWFDSYFTNQGIIILIMVVLACYIPLRTIRKMKVMNALRA